MTDEPQAPGPVIVDGVAYTAQEYEQVQSLIKSGHAPRAKHIMRRAIRRAIAAGKLDRPVTVMDHPRRHHKARP